MKKIIFIAVVAMILNFNYIQDHWQVSLTMVFGSLIAGATSEGGGAVAFPVFTKLLQINPTDAKNFSLAIQSVGMTMATIVIIYLGIRVEWRVIRWASLGGIIGIIISSIWLAPILPPAIIKMSFTAMISSFAITLFILNRNQRIFNKHLIIFENTERIILIGAGFLGGMMSGLVGNGIDIITFSIMVLLFKMNEKIATPTSVILMAINALVGFSVQIFILDGLNPQVYAYWQAAIPVVIIGAPLGAIICSRLNRIIIVRTLLVLIAIELISSVLLIPLTAMVTISGIITFMVFSIIYYWIYHIKRYEKKNWQKSPKCPSIRSIEILR